ncbi:alpha/beta fold hydrolase [Mycolicibacterium sp.]|uniref:alpha/beta fold hydrolase n=1 Tax=Mycolicibacterium sp. TaxID=2320850 RepID=UPI003D0B8151
MSAWVTMPSEVQAGRASSLTEHHIRLDHDDTSIRILQAGLGNEDGEAVVFLHGAGARADRWTHSLLACADRGRWAIAMDFPGHGYSTKGASPKMSVPGFADYVRRTCEGFGIYRVDLVGTSIGGHVAAAIAVAEPQFVASLTLVGPIGITPESDVVRTGLARAITDTSRVGTAAKLCRVVYDDRLVTTQWIDEEFAINNSEGAEDSFAALAEYFLTSYNDDVVGSGLRMKAPELPCLLVWGADDELVPATHVDHVLRLLPDGARWHVISNAGHAPYLEHPEVFNRLLLDFLANPSATSPPSGPLPISKGT